MNQKGEGWYWCRGCSRLESILEVEGNARQMGRNYGKPAGVGREEAEGAQCGQRQEMHFMGKMTSILFIIH